VDLATTSTPQVSDSDQHPDPGRPGSEGRVPSPGPAFRNDPWVTDAMWPATSASKKQHKGGRSSGFEHRIRLPPASGDKLSCR